jgi:predicted  nucleic acid-binding Zn-ribbon protein
LNWGVLNESVVQSLFALRKKVEQQRKEIGDLRKEVLQEQSEKADLEGEKEEQQQEVGKLEGERNRQEGTIAKLAAETEGLKDAKKKSEDELKRSAEANEEQGRELGQLKDDNRAIKAKEDRLVEEDGKQKEEIRRMAAQHDSLVKELAELKDLLNKFGVKQFPPSVKKGMRLVVPDGIIAHLTKACGGNVHDRHIVDVTSGSFEKETVGANPHSGAYGNNPKYGAKNAADFETDSVFYSAYRPKEEDIQRTRNNWMCYNFKERRIVPTHYAIRTAPDYSGGPHLKSWLVETSADGRSWRMVALEEDNKQLDGSGFTGTFAVAGGEECRFVRLVNIGRNHDGGDCLYITAWEIFGSLVE